MEQCINCSYFFQNEDLENHKLECPDRADCEKCNCDYLEHEVKKHRNDCRGFESMVCFVAEYSRQSHQYSFIRAFLKKLNISNEF
jgi:hypothetical protein